MNKLLIKLLSSQIQWHHVDDLIFESKEPEPVLIAINVEGNLLKIFNAYMFAPNQEMKDFYFKVYHPVEEDLDRLFHKKEILAVGVFDRTITDDEVVNKYEIKQ